MFEKFKESFGVGYAVKFSRYSATKLGFQVSQLLYPTTRIFFSQGDFLKNFGDFLSIFYALNIYAFGCDFTLYLVVLL